MWSVLKTQDLTTRLLYKNVEWSENIISRVTLTTEQLKKSNNGYKTLTFSFATFSFKILTSFHAIHCEKCLGNTFKMTLIAVKQFHSTYIQYLQEKTCRHEKSVGGSA